MVTTTPKKPFISPDFDKNVNELPRDVIEKYYDQFVAYSLDGRQILASGNTSEELYARVRELGYQPEEIVHSYIEDPNLTYLGPW